MKTRAVFAILCSLLFGGWARPQPPAFPRDRQVDARAVRSPAAHQVTTDPRLNAVASRIAGHAVTVGCYERGEPGSPYAKRAWGYVYMGGNYEYLDQAVCDGAIGILDHDYTIDSWKMAVGTLVLTHESFHLNARVINPDSEAKTECRAIRNTGRTIRWLGGDNTLVGQLIPYALAIHWRIAALFQDYYLPTCRVPNWW